jgi:hypothetical protein
MDKCQPLSLNEQNQILPRLQATIDLLGVGVSRQPQVKTI